jgi:HD-like signal output (HDOD) protein
MTFDERSWLGDSAAGARKARVPQSAAALAARVHGARPFPVACVNVLALTSKDDFDVEAVVAALESDPPMSARVLRLVNSSAFALRTRCTSIRTTVGLLGSRGIRSAVLAGSVLNLFPGADTDEWNSLHRHATRAAALARHLSPEWNVPADEMFTTAFLHDIGKWILLETEPEYAEVIARFGHAAESTLEEERGRFGFDHAELTEHMLSHWRIPQPIPRVVGMHHDPASGYAAEQKVAVRVALLRLSNLLAHAMERDVDPDFEALAKGEPLTYLGLSAQSLRERYAFLREQEREEKGDGSAEHSGMRVAVSPTRTHRTLPDEQAARAERAERAERKSAEVCAFCDAACFGVACKRCGARLCDLHTPSPGKVCAPCESEFAGRVRGTVLAGPKVTFSIAGVGLAASAGAFAALGAGWTTALPAVTLCAVAVFGTWRRWQDRKSFLAERPRSRPGRG